MGPQLAHHKQNDHINKLSLWSLDECQKYFIMMAFIVYWHTKLLAHARRNILSQQWLKIIKRLIVYLDPI